MYPQFHLAGAVKMFPIMMLLLLGPPWAWAAGTEGEPAAKTNAIESSVVKIFSQVRYPDYIKPWSKQSASQVTGSGVVIGRKRILSNAHVVQYASQVQVQASQTGDKMSATVEFIAPGIDLAVLKLDDESFFDSHPPLPFARVLPEIKDTVLVYGYPEGGSTLSITKGIVSRTEFTEYNYPVSGLRVQIDAAINPGNSGGPAVVDDKMIGLAFSRLGGADNIGYIIPTEEIELFLKDVEDGRYDGKPAMFDSCQTFENPALRPFLQMTNGMQGIIVHEPFETDTGYPLKEWDVITRVGDTAVDNLGMVRVGPSLRVYFTYLVQNLAKSNQVPLTVMRAGQELKVELPVRQKRPMVIPTLEGNYPAYFIYGPLAFSDTTREMMGYLTGSGERGARWIRWFGGYGSPLVKRVNDKPAFEGERLVIVAAPFFPHKLAKGYGDPQAQVVKAINGQAVKNLGHLVELLRDSKADFITLEFDSFGGETLVLPRVEAVAATDEILSDNGVRSQGSPDMLAVWNKGK